jgi:flavin-dependent dehydrogenase
VVVRRPARFQAAERRKDGRWRLTLSRHDQLDVVLADIVVDATGRHACFAATQGSRPRIAERLVGVAGLIELGPAEARCDHSTLVEAREAGWWYSSPVPGGRLILVWMSDADLVHQADLARRERWLEHLQAAPLTRQRVPEGTFPDGLSTGPARSSCLDLVCGPRWIAVGDAASVWDPLSSAGILKALRTGKLGAFAILDLVCGKADGMAKYRNCVEADYAHYQPHRQQVYRLEQRWRQSPFWRRRAESDAAPAV